MMQATSMKNFEILSKLGEGAFSCVFKVKRLSDNNEYALKKVKMSMLSEKEKENALNEVRILASINDPYIIAYKEAFFDEISNSLCVIMEYANGGDIQKKISEKIANKTLFNEPDVWKVFLQMVKGLKTLHDMQILHRDLKCANIFLTNTGDIKLGDLNVSKVAKKGLVYTQTGTPYYASPEVWRDKPYDMKSDMWSLGCVLYEMTALKPPFRANDMQGLYNKVQKGIYERIPLKFSNDLANLIGKCLQVNPTARPTCDQLITEISDRMKIQKNEEVSDSKEQRKALLETIKLPRNLKLLQEKLPKANYQKKPANEMENLYTQGSETKSKQRVLSADVRRVESNKEIGQKNMKSPLENQNNNQILPKRNDIYQPNYQVYNQNNNYYQNNQNNIYQKPPVQILQKNINNNAYQQLPPRPMLNNPTPTNLVNNQQKIVNNSPYQNNNNLHYYNNLNNNVNKSPINVINKSPINANANNGNLNYNRDRPISRGNNSRENSREKIMRNDISGNDIKRLEEKIAAKEKNLIGAGNNNNNIFSKNQNDELMRKYKEIVSGPALPSSNKNSNPNSNYKSPTNDLKKYYEEKKIEGPKISKVGSKDFPNPSPLTRNTPKSAKNSENMAAGQYLQGNKMAKPSWWG